MANLADTVRARLTPALVGYDAFAWLDFPNHANVGDSAIWLGMRRLLVDCNAEVRHVSDAAAYNPRVVEAALLGSSRPALLLHGGGNFGDLYTRHQALRERVIHDFSGVPIIQLPQTAHFTHERPQRESEQQFRRHADITLFARDQASAEVFAGLSDHVGLSPDTAHLLQVHLPPATCDVVVLGRQDKEAAGRPAAVGVDWPGEGRWSPQLLQRRVRRRLGHRTGALSRRALGLTWAPIAERRLKLGLRVLGAGEVIVTDRLHAALLGLLGGRPVVAVDNSYGKLSRYFSLWLPHGHTRLSWAGDLREAQEIAARLAS